VTVSGGLWSNRPNFIVVIPMRVNDFGDSVGHARSQRRIEDKPYLPFAVIGQGNRMQI